MMTDNQVVTALGLVLEDYKKNKAKLQEEHKEAREAPDAPFHVNKDYEKKYAAFDANFVQEVEKIMS